MTDTEHSARRGSRRRGASRANSQVPGHRSTTHYRGGRDRSRGALAGLAVTARADRVAARLGPPRVLRTDKGLEFCARGMLRWDYERDVRRRLLEAGKPTQNADFESFNRRFRDECLNEHWFTSPATPRPSKRGGVSTTRSDQALLGRTDARRQTAKGGNRAKSQPGSDFSHDGATSGHRNATARAATL